MNKSGTSTAAATGSLGVSISGSDLIDAKLEDHQVVGCGTKHCPGCGHKLEGKPDWLGLPAGVKFDPTDQELIEHLEAKAEAKDMKSHPLIDEFIPTIEGEDGICYTHPEKLPGVTRDGLSRHFFHRPSKAYTTGTRKRRKIQTECDLQGTGETRWHKTGKTRPVMVNGKQKGCKKILVLYTNFGKNRKPEKTNWVMHQYHLGQNEEEKEGELVVSKIFYQTQPRQCNWSDRGGGSSATGEGSSDTNSRRGGSGGGGGGGGGGSCSSKEVMIPQPQREDISGAGVVGVMSGFSPSADIHQQLKSEHYGFVPFRKGFDEVGIGEASTTREVPTSAITCDEYHPRAHHVTTHDHHHQQHQPPPPAPHGHHTPQMAMAAFHISRPSHSISTIIAPPPLHHTSVILDEDSYHVSRMMLQNEFQHQQQQQQQAPQQHHNKMGGVGGRSASGLEELIMGCTPSSSTDIKEESSIPNPQETDWLKYSSFWPDPDNPDHHG